MDGLEEDGEGPVLWIIISNEGGAQQGKYIIVHDQEVHQVHQVHQQEEQEQV